MALDRLPPTSAVWLARCLGSVVLAWLLGCLGQLQQAQLAPASHAWVLGGGGLLLLALATWRLWPGSSSRWCWAWLMLAVLASAALAWCATSLRAHARLSDRLVPALEGVDLVVDGRVAQMPQLSPDGLSMVFEVVSAQRLDSGQPVALPARLWLNWHRGWQEDALVTGPPDAVAAGEHWRLPVRLKRPHGAMNPGGFDAELWCFEQRLGAVGAVRAQSPQAAQRLSGVGWWPGDWVEYWRQQLRDRLLLAVSTPAQASVLAALAVGDQSAIDTAQWETFRRTGIAHLISISGLHITLFAWLAMRLVQWAWRRSGTCCLACPAPVAGRWGGVLLALAYALLAGWGIPAQRTVGMLFMAALLKGRAWVWPGPLMALVVAALVSAWDPWALLSPGFWLSFGAVWLLMLSSPAQALPRPTQQGWRPRARALLQEALHTQWVATVGLVPLTLLLFNQIAPLGALANLVAVPWVTLVVTPLALMGMVWSGFWAAAALALQPLLWWLQVLADWGGPAWGVPEAPLWASALALLGAAALVAPGPWHVRLLGLPLVLPMLWPAPQRPDWGQVELLALDVGQGSAVLLRTREHTLLHDTGPQLGRDLDAGQRSVLPALRARGEGVLSELILSHRDTDHVGGAAAVMAGSQVEALRSSLEPGHPLRRAGPPHTDCLAGQHWQWDGVEFRVLHPQGPAQAGERPNARSCVLQVTDADGRRLLVTGDIESPQEQVLVQRWGDALHSQVLVVPHHGSQTSSSQAFLDQVQPAFAVIQAGYRNRFGHPHPQVLARYQAQRIMVVQTQACGAWIWRAGQAECTREVRRRYWHWQADEGGSTP